MRIFYRCLIACAALMVALPLHAQLLAMPVLAYELAPGEIAHNGSASVRIFADGRVQLERPSYWRRAGTFELQLPLEQVAALVQQALSLDLAELKPDALEAAHAETSSGGTLFEVHDADRVTLVIRQLGLVREIEIAAPSAQMARLPNRHALSGLVDLDMRMRRLLADIVNDDVGRVRNEEMAR